MTHEFLPSFRKCKVCLIVCKKIALDSHFFDPYKDFDWRCCVCLLFYYFISVCPTDRKKKRKKSKCPRSKTIQESWDVNMRNQMMRCKICVQLALRGKLSIHTYVRATRAERKTNQKRSRSTGLKPQQWHRDQLVFISLYVGFFCLNSCITFHQQVVRSAAHARVVLYIDDIEFSALLFLAVNVQCKCWKYELDQIYPGSLVRNEDFNRLHWDITFCVRTGSTKRGTLVWRD